MKRIGWTLPAIVGWLALAGCSFGAREVDQSPQRNYTADIDASLNHGPTSMRPGMAGLQEPLGAFPWELGNSRQ